MNSKRIVLPAVLLVFCFGLHVSEAAAVPLPLKACKAITVSGSYILTKNIVAAGDCFDIQVDDVTIDLDGYTITGDGTGTGIWDNNVGRKNITVRNGVVSNFLHGIFLNSSPRARVERMDVSQNAGFGIRGGPGALIKDNIANDNGNAGIVAGVGSLITGNVANDNGSNGIIIFCPSNVIGNMATGNVFVGIAFSGVGCTHYNNNPAP